VTARENETDRQRGLDVGADAYIVKSSFRQEELLDAIGALT
jgi:two-component system chemotaxis sensor kinase CheA